MEKIQFINSVINAINEANTPNECRLVPSDRTAEQINSYIEAYNKRFADKITKEEMEWLYDFADNLPHGILHFIKYVFDVEQ